MPRIELTDSDIRGVGIDRYLWHRRWRLLAGLLLLIGWAALVGWLVPDDPVWLWLIVRAVPPYGALLWGFWRAIKAGRRFLAQWIDEH